MSVPYEVIACKSCGYAETTLVTAGKFVWSADGAEFWMDRQLGLCQDCASVVAMEKFPALSIFAEAQRRRASWWRRKLGRFGADEAGTLAAREGFAVLERVMATGRRPVCLNCASTNVTKLDLPDGGPRNTQSRAIGIRHPGCGGEMTVRGSGAERVAPMEVTRIYDMAGSMIGKRRGWR